MYCSRHHNDLRKARVYNRYRLKRVIRCLCVSGSQARPPVSWVCLSQKTTRRQHYIFLLLPPLQTCAERPALPRAILLTCTRCLAIRFPPPTQPNLLAGGPPAAPKANKALLALLLYDAAVRAPAAVDTATMAATNAMHGASWHWFEHFRLVVRTMMSFARNRAACVHDPRFFPPPVPAKGIPPFHVVNSRSPLISCFQMPLARPWFLPYLSLPELVG